jgi:glutamate dehydrogenase
MLVGAEQRRLHRRTKELVKLGLPEDLAGQAASLLDVYSLLDIAEISYDTGTAADVVAPMYFLLSERFQVDTMLGLITRLPRDDRWDALARAALRYDLYAALEQLTVSVISSTDPSLPPHERIAAWDSSNRDSLTRVRDMVTEVSHLEHVGIAALSVALRGLRAVVRSNAAG